MDRVWLAGTLLEGLGRAESEDLVHVDRKPLQRLEDARSVSWTAGEEIQSSCIFTAAVSAGGEAVDQLGPYPRPVGGRHRPVQSEHEAQSRRAVAVPVGAVDDRPVA